MFEVSFLAVLAAAATNVIIGMIWYNPRFFGTTWALAAGISPQQMEVGKKRMPLMAFFGFLASMLMAYVLMHFGIAWGVFDWIGGVELGIWTWLGFVMPVLLGSILWETKPFKYFAINASYWLLSLVAMGVVLVLFS